MMEGRRQRKCRCGHAKGDPMIVEEPEYTLWGWIVLSMFGITPKPDHVVYRCQMCRQSLGSTRDPKVLARRSQAGSEGAPAAKTSVRATQAREPSEKNKESSDT